MAKLGVSLVLLVSLGCGDDASIGTDTGRVDAGARRRDAGAPGTDAGTTRPDAGEPDAGVDGGAPDGGFDGGAPDAGFDAGAPDAGYDAGTFIELGWYPIDRASAECLGLTSPACAACHFRDGVWYLLPRYAPPPPPDIPSVPYEACGVPRP